MHSISGVNFEEVDLQVKTDKSIERLSNQLYELVDKFYLINNQSSFVEKILFPELPGTLVLYHLGHQLVGFTRLVRQILTINGISYAVYSGGSYHNPSIEPTPYISRICLTQALRYKLFHPHQKLVYFANCNNPQRYTYVRELYKKSNSEKNGDIAKFVHQLMKQLCNLNKWQFDPNNPLLVKGLLPLKPIWQQYEPSNIDEFLELNPCYMNGDCLFMYLPFDMQSLGWSINRSISDVNIGGGLLEYT